MLALRLLEDSEKTAIASRPSRVNVKGAAEVPPPAPVAGPAAVSAALAGLPVSVSEGPGEVRIAFRHVRQFASGAVTPAPDFQPALRQGGKALGKVPGTLVVAGHADASPVHGRSVSNQAISEARAQSAAKLIAAEIGDAGRVRAEGRGDASPLDAGRTPAARAKNRRVELVLKAP